MAMLEQWGMSEKITGCDLDNGRFPFNFDNEEDLNSVLSKAPFHQNFCMFVLVRWKPGIDDNYPSLVPFWVHLQGIPLHLCTHKNLEAIGNRLRKVDKIGAAKGKIRVELDSSKPLKFSRTLQAEKRKASTSISTLNSIMKSFLNTVLHVVLCHMRFKIVG